MRRFTVALIAVTVLTGLGAAQPPKLKVGEIQIAADGPLDLDLEKGIAHLSKNVRVTTQDGIMRADKMDVTLGDMSTIQALTATGHVHIKVKTLTKKKEEIQIDARSDTATYQQKERLFTLKGNVTGKMVIPARRQTIDLTADVAVIWLDENRVHLEPANLVITQPKETPEAAAPKQ